MNFAFETGDFVMVEGSVDPSRLYTINERRVHQFGEGTVNQYCIPDLGKGETSWIDESLLKKWDGEGKLTLTLFFDESEDKSDEELEIKAHELLERVRDIVEKEGLPRDSISLVGINRDSC